MKKYVAELIGTFALVLFGCGAAVVSGATPELGVSGIGLLGISLAFGITVMVMAYTIGPVSGCHINPAISISMLVAGKLSAKDCAGYITGQVTGAVLASGALLLILKGNAKFTLGEYGLGANGFGEMYLGKYSVTAAFITETLLTFLFLFVIFGSTSKSANPNLAGVAIGFALVLIHLVAIPITGTSVNPARSLAPAIFAGGFALQQVWLFILAPVTGGILAAFVWKGVFEK